MGKLITIIISAFTAVFGFLIVFMKIKDSGKKEIIAEQDEKTLEKISEITKDQNKHANDTVDDIDNELLDVSRKTKQ